MGFHEHCYGSGSGDPASSGDPARTAGNVLSSMDSEMQRRCLFIYFRPPSAQDLHTWITGDLTNIPHQPTETRQRDNWLVMR